MRTTASKSSRVEVAEGPRAPQPIVKRGLRPILRRDFRDNLLGEHVERPVGDCKAVELAATHAVEQSGAFDQIVARKRKQPPLGSAADGVAGTAYTLQEGGDRTGRTELADEVHVADIDPEFERGGRDQGLELAAFQALLGHEPFFLGHAAVMRGDRALAETLRQLSGDALRHASRVDEHQGRPVFFDQPRQALINLGPHFARHHRLERRIGHFKAEVARPMMPGIDDRGLIGRQAV